MGAGGRGRGGKGRGGEGREGKGRGGEGREGKGRGGEGNGRRRRGGAEGALKKSPGLIQPQDLNFVVLSAKRHGQLSIRPPLFLGPFAVCRELWVVLPARPP